MGRPRFRRWWLPVACLWVGARWDGFADGRRVTPGSRRATAEPEPELEAETPEPWAAAPAAEPAESAASEPPHHRRRRLLSGSQAQASSADEHLVTDLPGLNTLFAPRQWAGHVKVDNRHDGWLFYWLLEAETDSTPDAPLIVWLNGGPGCSSMDGLFLENGPFRLTSKLDIEVNEASWTKAGWVVYIDQPVGTGLSFTRGKSYPHNDGDINLHLLAFFDGLFALHPHLAGKELFLTGESHAGHYIPSLALAMLRRNSKGVAPHQFNLAGLAIGNGWFDPWRQYDVSSFAHSVGLISAGQVHSMKQKEKACHAKLEHGTYMSTMCWDLLDDIVRDSGLGAGMPKVLMYDVRRYAKSSSAFPPNHERVEQYLNRKDVRVALHASQCPITFKECTDPPYDALRHQDGLGVTHELKQVLDAGVRTLFYNGQYDLICNHLNVEAALDALSWSGGQRFQSATHGVWAVGGKAKGNPSGYVRTAGALTLLLVLDSGHMVPMDKPVEALDMIARFVQGKSFTDAKQGIKSVSRHGRALLAPPPAHPATPAAEADRPPAGPGVTPTAGAAESGSTETRRDGAKMVLAALLGVGVGLLVGVGTGMRWARLPVHDRHSRTRDREAAAPLEVALVGKFLRGVGVVGENRHGGV